MSKAHLKNVKAAQAALKSFQNTFEKVIGPISENYTNPIANVLRIEEDRASEQAKWDGMSGEEIEAQKKAERDQSLKDMVEAANAALAKKTSPKEIEVVEGSEESTQ